MLESEVLSNDEQFVSSSRPKTNCSDEIQSNQSNRRYAENIEYGNSEDDPVIMGNNSLVTREIIHDEPSRKYSSAKSSREKREVGSYSSDCKHSIIICNHGDDIRKLREGKNAIITDNSIGNGEGKNGKKHNGKGESNVTADRGYRGNENEESVNGKSCDGKGHGNDITERSNHGNENALDSNDSGTRPEDENESMIESDGERTRRPSEDNFMRDDRCEPCDGATVGCDVNEDGAEICGENIRRVDERIVSDQCENGVAENDDRKIEVSDSDLDDVTAKYLESLKKSKKKIVKETFQDSKDINTMTFDPYEIRTSGTEFICKKIEAAYLVKHLNLTNCDLNKIPKIEELFQTCFERYCLETLNISHNNLPDISSEIIGRGIQESCSLRELDLSHNRFGDVAAKNIGTAIGKNQSILKLNIGWNQIRTKGAVVFMNSMKRNRTLSSLNVSWNGFGYEGVLAVSEFLKKNKSLLELELSSNRIDWKAAALIAEALAVNRVLRRLELGDNPLTTNGCMDIIEALDANDNSALVYLGLKNVPVVGDFAIAVQYLQNRRDFLVHHGGIVGSHDVLGFKQERRVTAIEKVADFIKDKKIRKTEFFRLLDINAEGKLNPDKLRARIKKINIGLPEHEITELIAFLMDEDPSSSNIDFRKIAASMNVSSDKQRLEKIGAAEEKAKLRELHEKILDV